MRKPVLIVTTLVLIASAGAAIAEEGPLPPPVQVVANVLQLSEAQVASWLPILRSREEALRPLQQERHANQEAIEKAVQSPSPDAQTIGELFIARRALEMKVAAVSSESAAQFEQLLTSDQRERLHQIRAASHVCAIVPPFAATGLL